MRQPRILVVDARGVAGLPYASLVARLQPLELQVAVIEFARNVLGLTDADSTEFERADAYRAAVRVERQALLEREALLSCSMTSEVRARDFNRESSPGSIPLEIDRIVSIVTSSVSWARAEVVPA